jgi:hypothetical protein|nr:MAG TPA: hypothetical protein [Caudoviricetes sp.]
MTIQYLKEYFENTETPKFYLKDIFPENRNGHVTFITSKKGSKAESLMLIELLLSIIILVRNGSRPAFSENTKVYLKTDFLECSDTDLQELSLNT